MKTADREITPEKATDTYGSKRICVHRNQKNNELEEGSQPQTDNDAQKSSAEGGSKHVFMKKPHKCE